MLASIHPSIYPSPPPIFRASSPLRSILTQILPKSPNSNNMAQILAKWTTSKQSGPNPSKLVQIWSESKYLKPEFGLMGHNDVHWARIGMLSKKKNMTKNRRNLGTICVFFLFSCDNGSDRLSRERILPTVLWQKRNLPPALCG